MRLLPLSLLSLLLLLSVSASTMRGWAAGTPLGAAHFRASAVSPPVAQFEAWARLEQAAGIQNQINLRPVSK